MKVSSWDQLLTLPKRLDQLASSSTVFLLERCSTFFTIIWCECYTLRFFSRGRHEKIEQIDAFGRIRMRVSHEYQRYVNDYLQIGNSEWSALSRRASKFTFCKITYDTRKIHCTNKTVTVRMLTSSLIVLNSNNIQSTRRISYRNYLRESITNACLDKGWESANSLFFPVRVHYVMRRQLALN